MASWKLLLRSRKATLLGVGLFVFIAVSVLIYNETRQITTQAFINAPVVTVRAPIPGRIKLTNGLQVGLRVSKGDVLGAMDADTENPRISELTGLIADLLAQRGARQSEIESITAQLTHRNKELSIQRQRASVQQAADVQGAQASLAVTRADFERANVALKDSMRRVARAESLRAAGFISPAAYENVQAEEEQMRASQNAAKEASKRAEVVLSSARYGVQIEGVRGMPYVVTRSQELDQSITDLTARKLQLEKQVTLISDEIAVLQGELTKQSIAGLISPVQGAIWSIDANSGDSVERHGSVLQLVNCDDRWVEAFFSEKDAARIAEGARVKVRSYYVGIQEWSGQVLSVRYGTGRVTVGQYVVDPPPEVMRRQLPVRVATARIQVNWGGNDGNAPLCNVGRSVEVFPD